MRFSNPSKICPLILCLMLNFSATGTPRFRGAAFCMKEIKLSPSKYGQFFALVDDDDYDRLNQFKWYPEKKQNLFYARTKDKTRKAFYMHRFILNTEKEIDHRNHNTLDNQKSNLRECTKSQNQRNKSAKKNGTSKYLGVRFVSDRNKWRADISDGKSSIFLGEYFDEQEAAAAYNRAAKSIHGEFANLNKL